MTENNNSSIMVPCSKRPLENSNGPDGEEPPAKRASNSVDAIFRMVVSASKIGKVIGKQGTRIEQLREEIGAHITIGNPVSFLEDRVIMISSKEEAETAELALMRLATILMEDNEENNSNAKTGHQNAPNLIRLLIGRSQAGCLIGKAGATINEIRENSEASIKILPLDQLPFCLCIGATDRLIQISGKVFQVEKALEMIASKLRENPARENLTVKPNPYFGSHSLLFPLGLAQHSQLRQKNDAVLPKIATQISVSNSLIGGVIGRGGANITHIRAVSGCSVKVQSQIEGSPDRVISFEGAPEQISTAQSLVQAFIQAQ